MRLVDMTHLVWDTNPTKTLGTGGTYLKSIDSTYNPLRYYKMPMYDNYLKQCVGYETIFEVITYRLCQLLGIESLKYDLLYASICIDTVELFAYITESVDFKKPGESKLTLESYYYLKRRDSLETAYDFCNRVGFGNYIDTMLLVDFLICNRDRHGANIEVLTSGDSYRLAPLFDNGLSFVAPFGNNLEAICNFNPLLDTPCNNFIGSRSLFTNLELISDYSIPTLPDNWKIYLSSDIEESLPKDVWLKVFEIIERRYEYVCSKKVFNKRCGL